MNQNTYLKLAGCAGVGATAVGVGMVAGPIAGVLAGVGALLTCVPAALHDKPEWSNRAKSKAGQVADDEEPRDRPLPRR